MGERRNKMIIRSAHSLHTTFLVVLSVMTYERDGRQYVVLAAGGHLIFYPQKVSDWLIAYALPE